MEECSLVIAGKYAQGHWLARGSSRSASLPLPKNSTLENSRRADCTAKTPDFRPSVIPSPFTTSLQVISLRMVRLSSEMSTPIATPPASERGGRSAFLPLTTPDGDVDPITSVIGALAIVCTFFVLISSIYWTLSGTPDESQIYPICGLELPVFMVVLVATSVAFSKLASARHPKINRVTLALPVPFAFHIASWGIYMIVPDPVLRLHTIFLGLLGYLSLISSLIFVAVYPCTTTRTEASPLNLMV
ncbi:hypothetical protein BKA58DRAFT_380743 [Alternaria rosae]|uniref:uncharacterized protein n=1 Tax=Alternaria rosae TaxID=1187941 RepID=UPI001E8DF6BB|nr:uncharacterized protein BKA58DRAFT_380743 [Alternaria rosae]KAH6875947.1 hypothetical protein BKA58DRAFT_380743 [Alternaria rosae]